MAAVADERCGAGWKSAAASREEQVRQQRCRSRYGLGTVLAELSDAGAGLLKMASALEICGGDWVLQI